MRWILLSGAVAVMALACSTVRAESVRAGAAASEPVSTLMEKGVYYQETVGDLDSAIRVYQKIVADAQANRKYAAEAQYRLGMCLLKKGQQEEGVGALQKVVEQYGDQAATVKLAKEQIRQARQKMGGAEVGKIVAGAVGTISTCAEGDPKIGQAMKSLEGLDEKAVVTHLAEYLD